MQNFSQTQASNLASLAGFIMILLNHYKINITTEEIQAFLGAGLIIVGLVWNWYHRYSKGGLTVTGVRTSVNLPE